MTASPLKIAQNPRELIESEADRVDEKLTLTKPIVDKLVESGLFRLLVPRDLGGLEADPSTIIDVFEELSFADGSVGWAFAQNTTVMAYSAYLDRECGMRLAKAPAAAGMFASLGVAHKEEKGITSQDAGPLSVTGSVGSPPRARWSNAFDDGGRSHAAASAHRHQTDRLVLALEFIEERSDQHAAGCTNRMPQ